MVLTLAALAVVLAVVAVAALVVPRWMDARLTVHRRVLVNLRTGNAVSGVVTHRTRYVIVVSDAQLHEVGSTGPVPMDGDVILERTMVEFIQRYAERRD